MKKIFKNIIVFAGLIVFLILPVLVSAANLPSGGLNFVATNGTNSPYKPIAANNDLAGIIGIVIQSFLGLLGVLFLVYVLYAGYNWMVAQGDEEKVTKAKETIQRAVIGLIVTIAAYAISYWVFDKLIFSNTGILN